MHGVSLRLWLLSATLTVLAGCAPTPQPQPLQGEIAIRIERDPDVTPGEMIIKPIRGAFNGKAEGETIRFAIVDDIAMISVEELVSIIGMQAASAIADARNPGELANPREMKLARLAIFYRPGNGECGNYRAGLKVNRPTGAVLMYVDRAGSIRGSRYVSPWIMEYALDFPAPGLYLVGLQAQGPVVTQRLVPAAGPLTMRVSSDC